ncbi:MAG: glycosyltransferase [Candidatus Eremiobacteraeota bacterium]|nr:glycosyltransferase [Candidatus Eremiobacteraeota bacterium]
MKIAIFTEVYRPIVNGVVTSIDSLAEQLRILGHDVFTFAPHIPKGAESAGRVFRMPSLPLPARTEYRLTLPLVARRNKARFLSQCDVIHSHSLFITGWMASYYARRRFRMPLIYTYHTLLERYAHYSPLGPRLTSQLTRELTKTYANAADAVIVPTKAVAAELRKHGVSAPICVVPTGIDIDAFRRADRATRLAIRDRFGIPHDAPLLLLVSRLAQEKNVPLAVEALQRLRQRLPAAHLLLVGNGPRRHALTAHVREAGLEGVVHFAGSVEHSEIHSFYAASDVFVFPSVTETQGLVLAEAFAAGLPVVALDNPQTRDVFGEHLAGEIVADAESMANALWELICNRERRLTAVTHAKTAAATFDARATAGRVLAIYEAVVSNLRGGTSLVPENAFVDLFTEEAGSSVS